MRTTKNHEIINEDIYTKATNLTNEGYLELQSTDPYNKCDSLIINNQKKVFWFSTIETLNHTKKVIKSLN